jgi:hypothetical protein
MHIKSINFSNEALGPSDYTIKLLLDFSKTIKVIRLKKARKITMHCN